MIAFFIALLAAASANEVYNTAAVVPQQYKVVAVQQPQHFAAQQIAIRAPVVAYDQRAQFVAEPQYRFPVDKLYNRRLAYPSDHQQYRRNVGPVHFSSYFLKGTDLYSNQHANQAAIAPQVVPQVVPQHAAVHPIVTERQVYSQVAAHVQPQQFVAKYQRTYQEPKVDNYSAQDLVAN